MSRTKDFEDVKQAKEAKLILVKKEQSESRVYNYFQDQLIPR